MSSIVSLSSVASMQKWGIPGPESSVLERLVWVRYADLWWPAILYQSYMELQQQIYTQFSSYVVKAQFALAIMRQMQEKRNVQVARLLGRLALEIVEVEEGDYHDFYWNVSELLPEACDKTKYAGRMDLFLDVHKALDEVEQIFREVTNDSILFSTEEQGTWLERARAKLEGSGPIELPKEEDASVNSLRHFRDTMKRSEGKVDWGPLQKQRSSNIPNQLQATKSPHINLPTVREEQTSIGGSTRCIGVPHAMAQEKSYLDEGWAKLVDPPLRSGVRQSPATDAPRKSSTASPTDELARIRRERQSRPGSKGISANEHSQRYREKSIRQDFNGASIDEIGPPKRDKALPLHGSTEAPSTKSSLPTVVIADVSRRSTGSRSRGASSDEYLLMKRDRSTPIRRSGDTRSNETGYRVAMMADQSRRSTVSGSKAASMEDQPRTRQDFALPHPGSTDALLRARCSPIPSSVNPSRKSNVSADSAATKSVRIPRKPEMIPLRQHDPSVRSKDRTRVEFPMTTTTMQDSGPAISRDDTEKANNLSVIVSGHLPASPSMPLTPKRGSALGGYDSKFKYRPSRISGLGSPEHVEDRNPPTTLRHDSHSLLMESQKQIHSSLPTSQRDQKTGLPFCGVKLMY